MLTEDGEGSLIQSLQIYNNESSVGSLFERIKINLHKNINSDFNDLCLSSRILLNLNYSLFFSQINLNETISLLKPLNFKKHSISTNFDDLIHYLLFENPELFSHITYFCLIDSELLNNEEKFFYTFLLIPSIFIYLITNDIQNLFFKFIKCLFQIHLTLFGYNLTLKHEFINFIFYSIF